MIRAAALCLLVALVVSHPLYSYEGHNEMPPGDDSCTEFFPFNGAWPFMDDNSAGFIVGSNGIVNMDLPDCYSPPFPCGFGGEFPGENEDNGCYNPTSFQGSDAPHVPIIAPFWNDINTDQSGQIYYHQEEGPSPVDSLLNFNSQEWIQVTWEQVPYYTEDNSAVRFNTFQTIAGTDRSDSFVCMIYPNAEENGNLEGGLGWSNPDGLDGIGGSGGGQEEEFPYGGQGTFIVIADDFTELSGYWWWPEEWYDWYSTDYWWWYWQEYDGYSTAYWWWYWQEYAGDVELNVEENVPVEKSAPSSGMDLRSITTRAFREEYVFPESLTESVRSLDGTSAGAPPVFDTGLREGLYCFSTTDDIIPLVCDEPCLANPFSCDGATCVYDFQQLSGECVDTTVECNDDPPCLTSYCFFGSCIYQEACPQDRDACTFHTCENSNGLALCDLDFLDCDDANICTDDSCDRLLGCQHNPVVCGDDDDDRCTVPTGECTPEAGCIYEQRFCDDGNPCTIDYCDHERACQITWKECDDENPCTYDSCNEETGECEFMEKVCDDGSDCTDDFCDQITGECQAVDNGLCFV